MSRDESQRRFNASIKAAFGEMGTDFCFYDIIIVISMKLWLLQ